MIRSLIGLAVITAVFAAGTADAQSRVKPTKKLYRWVDKDGKVQFSDALPPEAVDQARTEINATSGRATSSVDRALSPEERIAKEKLDLEQAASRKEAEQVRQTEEAMVASFRTEDDLKRSFKVRTELLQQTLDALEAGIGSQRNSLASLLADASESELEGKPVNKKQAETIRELHSEMNKQQQMMVLKQGELVALDQELLRLLERFRELKAGGDAATPAPAPAEAGAAADEAAATPAG